LKKKKKENKEKKKKGLETPTTSPKSLQFHETLKKKGRGEVEEPGKKRGKENSHSLGAGPGLK